MFCCAPEEKDGKKVEPFVILHETPARNRWDVLMFLTIIVVCIVVPIRIGFDIREWKAWIGPDIVIDLLLFLDIFVVALTTFEQDGEVVRDRKLIWLRYAKTWFAPDVLSILPLELFTLATPGYNPAFRANRLLRIGRLVYFFVSWEKVSSLKPSVIRIAKSTFVIVFLAHFIGCVFFGVILLEGDAATTDFTGTVNITNRSLGSKYLRSFYWSFVTMTGYNNTNPNTQLETIFCIFVTMIGISLFATIIGTVGSLVTNLDSSKLYFRQKMDGINDYMKYKRIPAELQNEVRNYYSYLWKSGKGLDKNKVLDDLPPYLKNKMNVYLNSEIIKKVDLFQQCKDDQEFITEIVKCLKSRVCLPNSFVVRKGETGTEMYFISRGELNVVNEEDKVVFTLRDGQFFGEVALLYDTKRTASIVARTYCDMFILTKEDFTKVMKKFPMQSKGIREIARKRFQHIHEQNEQKEKEAAQTTAKAPGDGSGSGEGSGNEDSGKEKLGDQEMKPASGSGNGSRASSSDTPSGGGGPSGAENGPNPPTNGNGNGGTQSSS